MVEQQKTDEESGAPVTRARPASGFASRVLNIFVEPKRVFDFLRDRGDFWRPFVFHFLVLSVMGYLTLPGVKEFTAQYMNMLGRETPAGVVLKDYIMAPVNVAIGLAISFAVLGFVIWLVALIFAGSARYGQAVSLAAYTYFPVLLGKVVNSFTLMVAKPVLGDPVAMTVAASPAINYTSLAQFIGGSPILQTAFLPVGIFTLWALYLLVIGLRRSAGVSATAAWVAAVTILAVQMGLYALIAFSISMGLKAAGAG